MANQNQPYSDHPSPPADDRQARVGDTAVPLLRDVATGKVLGDTTTLSDPEVVSRIKRKYEED